MSSFAVARVKWLVPGKKSAHIPFVQILDCDIQELRNVTSILPISTMDDHALIFESSEAWSQSKLWRFPTAKVAPKIIQDIRPLLKPMVSCGSKKLPILSKYIAATARFEWSQDVEVVRTFNAMGLKEDVLRGVFAYGFEK